MSNEQEDREQSLKEKAEVKLRQEREDVFKETMTGLLRGAARVREHIKDYEDAMKHLKENIAKTQKEYDQGVHRPSIASGSIIATGIHISNGE